ncbi:SRPBCC family protein [Nocardia sp. CA2R105]|uniref:SRPBCC family protein n=1 Tax=Nocardia coffeae TaxID=2873381 RepID=UPI001CA676EE|nr:SRPBCC family protein [Nocardia coffeae]MBY8857174.1 SRPBCC family protein [Nocardia coffeae]
MPKTLSDTTTGVGKAASNTVGRIAEAATRVGETARDTRGPAPTGVLQQSMQNLAGTLAERAVAGLSNRATRTADRLNEYAEGGGGNLLAAVTGVEKLAGGASPFQAAMSAGIGKLGHTFRENFESVKDSLTGGSRKGGAKKLKLANIVEHIDVGVPVDLAYDQWTQFADFPKFTKKLEQVEQISDEKLSWTGKVFWSRRTWESTIVEQVPFERIVWRSKGAKGYIDGAVSFHELTPDLTRILVVLEYHPQGVFEKTANLWRAAGRRCRLELKHFQRYVMTESVLHGEDIVGWHGEIRDNEVVQDDETARRAEQANTEDDLADEETDEEEETDEQDEDQRDLDEQDEESDSPPRPTAARRSPTTRRSRVSGGASR